MKKIDISSTLERRRRLTDDFTFTSDIDDVLGEAYAVAREGRPGRALRAGNILGCDRSI